VTRIDLVKARQQFIRDGYVGFEPTGEGLGGFEELWGGRSGMLRKITA
jgi:hypothetical protein